MPERHLYPRYVAALRAGKERLAAIFQRGEELCSAFGALVIDDEALLLRRASDLGLDTGSVPLLKTVVLIDAFRLAGAVPAKRYDGAEVDLTRVPLDAVVLAQLPLLYRHRASLADYARTVLAL